MPILDYLDTIAGEGIVRDQNTGHIQIKGCPEDNVSGVTIWGVSGQVEFKDQYLQEFLQLSESGVTGVQTVNGFTSIAGLLNQIGKIFISSNDTTADYAENKFTSVSGITLTVLNEGANEQLQIGVNASGLADIIKPYIVHNNLDGLQGGTVNQYYHLTAQELIDLTSGLSADNQHYHNASAIQVDDTCFDIVSGTQLQEVLCVIDELLKTRNTLLVNFDIAGSVRNGNTCLGLTDNTPFVQFRHNKEGFMGLAARVPENYYAGTDLTYTFKWYSVGANTDNVRWELNYKGLAAGENVTTAASTLATTVAEPGVIGQIVETTFTIPGGTFVLGDVMIFDLRRLGDDALDTSTENSRVIEVSLDY